MARFENITEIEPDLQGAGLRIGIAMGRFNRDIGEPEPPRRASRGDA